MTQRPAITQKATLIGGAVVLVLAVAGLGLTGWSAGRSDAQSAETAAPAPVDFEQFRNAMRDESLTEEQRREMFEKMREAREAEMDQRVAEYFGATEEERVAILDKHIDEFEARRREWEARRAEREAEEGDDRGEREESREERREQWRERMRSQSQAERKERSESRNPDQQGQRMAYFSAMRSRMESRGIQPPGGGFRSRWMMPAACAASRPARTCRMIPSARASGRRPSRWTRSPKVSPAT